MLLLYRYTCWFQQLIPFHASALEPATTFTIVIPARNEEASIGKCLSSIMNGNYPHELFEVLVIDDHSEDNTAAVVAEWTATYPNIQCISLKHYVQNKLNSYKKKAIEVAISASAFEWIITTDADSVVGAKWLNDYDNFIQTNNSYFVAAPVLFESGKGALHIFQELDFLTLQGITAASVSAGFHSMCNGANLAYRKDIFRAVNGFSGIDKIASGDDMLLMHKIQAAYPNKIGYLFSRNAVVFTQAERSLQGFFHQRIRWASKSTSYNDKKITFVLLLVYAVNLSITALFVTAVFNAVFWTYFFVFLGLKTAVEFIFLVFVAGFYKKRALLAYFFLMQPFHIIYTITAGFFGLTGSYKWKGRVVK